MDEKMAFLTRMHCCSNGDLKDNATLYLFNSKEGLWFVWAFDVGYLLCALKRHKKTNIHGLIRKPRQRYNSHLQKNHTVGPVGDI